MSRLSLEDLPILSEREGVKWYEVEVGGLRVGG